MSGVTCDYCGGQTRRVDDLYPHLPHLPAKRGYRCDPCQAWVGVHPGTWTPLGRLANAELRKAKMAAHDAFDPLWKGKPKGERSKAYARLAEALGIPGPDCHIGMFDVAMCRRVVEVSRALRASKEVA